MILSENETDITSVKIPLISAAACLVDAGYGTVTVVSSILTELDQTGDLSLCYYARWLIEGVMC